MAAILIVLERAGKALRSPATDTIVSQASAQVGVGFGFGLREAMDQIGAILGPLIFALFFMFLGSAEKPWPNTKKATVFFAPPFS